MDTKSFIANLGHEPTDEEANAWRRAPAPDTVDVHKELVIEPASGRVRQAGAADADGKWVIDTRTRAERSLYFFSRAVLKRTYLTPSLHKPIADWLQAVPPWRKMLRVPRECCKTTLVAHAMPLHILIQPREHNIYFPGEDGSDQRILLVGKSEQRSKDAVRVQQAAIMTNELLRAFWPHRVWQGNPRAQAPKWNDSEYMIPRGTEWPDPSVRGIGIGVAITGAHPSTVLEDDLINEEDANSAVTMETAIQGHITLRALVNRPNALNVIIGTPWAVHDLYTYIEQTDPTTARLTRSIVEDGKSIYPEVFTDAVIDDRRRTFGSLFQLLYMCNANDPSLTDFQEDDLRYFSIRDGAIEFTEDTRDVALLRRMDPAPRDTSRGGVRSSQVGAGAKLTPELLGTLARREEYLRLRVG